MSVTWSLAPAPRSFGLIRTNLTQAEIVDAFRRVDRLRMRIAAMMTSSAYPTETRTDADGNVATSIMRIDEDDHLQHRVARSADPRDETPVQIVVASHSPLCDVTVSVRIARCLADRLTPKRERPDLPMGALVGLMTDALEEAAVQAGSHADMLPRRPDQTLVQGAALTLAPERDVPAIGTVMAAGPSRLTPGLIRVGPSGAMRNVDPERAHVASIPAWSRLDGMCHDGSDGSRPMVFVELAELRLQRSLQGLTMPDRMRAIARWADASRE